MLAYIRIIGNTKAQIAGLQTQRFNRSGVLLEWGLRICVANMCLSNSETADLATTL